jgi:hypothetical protein
MLLMHTERLTGTMSYFYFYNACMAVSEGAAVLQLMGNSTDYVIDVAPGVDWTAVCAMLMVMKQVRSSVSACCN